MILPSFEIRDELPFCAHEFDGIAPLSVWNDGRAFCEHGFDTFAPPSFWIRELALWVEDWVFSLLPWGSLFVAFVMFGFHDRTLFDVICGRSKFNNFEDEDGGDETDGEGSDEEGYE